MCTEDNEFALFLLDLRYDEVFVLNLSQCFVNENHQNVEKKEESTSKYIDYNVLVVNSDILRANGVIERVDRIFYCIGVNEGL